jgi:hypothetical protein
MDMEPVPLKPKEIVAPPLGITYVKSIFDILYIKYVIYLIYYMK